MKKPGKYESTLEATILSLDLVTQMDKTNFLELRDAAYKIDVVREQLRDAAERLAERCTTFARDVADGRVHMTPVTNSSLIGDIAQYTAVLNEKTESFPTMLRFVLGPTAAKEFYGILRS